MKTRYPLRPILVLLPACLALLLIAGILSVGRSAPSAVPEHTADYQLHVAPLLARRCGSCHGTPPLGGFQVTSHASVLNSGDHGPNIIPGDANSPLLRLVQGQALPYAGPMPPASPLTRAEIDLLTRWVEAGAPD